MTFHKISLKNKLQKEEVNLSLYNESAPGGRIKYLRNQRHLTQREFVKLCEKSMDFTALGRIERNLGYTRSSLEKIAKVLNCEVYDFFIPKELKDFTNLSEEDKKTILSLIKRLSENSQDTTKAQKPEL